MLALTLTPTLHRTIKTVLNTSPPSQGPPLSTTHRTILQTILESNKSSVSLNELEIIANATNVPLQTLIKGSEIRVPCFEQKTVVADPAQELRKAKLKLRAEERELARMVANVDSRQVHANKHRAGAAVSLQSASFGLHIIIGMVFGFLAGYLLARTVYGGSQTVRIVGGIVGMVGTLIMEVVLYIVRDEKARLLSTKMNEKILKGQAIHRRGSSTATTSGTGTMSSAAAASTKQQVHDTNKKKQ